MGEGGGGYFNLILEYDVFILNIKSGLSWG